MTKHVTNVLCIVCLEPLGQLADGPPAVSVVSETKDTQGVIGETVCKRCESDLEDSLLVVEVRRVEDGLRNPHNRTGHTLVVGLNLAEQIALLKDAKEKVAGVAVLDEGVYPGGIVAVREFDFRALWRWLEKYMSGRKEVQNDKLQ